MVTGRQVSFYLDDDRVEFLQARANTIGISRSLVLKMAIDLLMHTDDCMLEINGEGVSTTRLELLSQALVSAELLKHAQA